MNEGETVYEWYKRKEEEHKNRKVKVQNLSRAERKSLLERHWKQVTPALQKEIHVAKGAKKAERYMKRLEREVAKSEAKRAPKNSVTVTIEAVTA